MGNTFKAKFEKESYLVLKNSICVTDLLELDRLTKPMYESDFLFEQGALKDLYKGKVLSKAEISLPQVDRPDVHCPKLLELSLWKALEGIAMEALSRGKVELFGTHMLLKPKRSIFSVFWHQDIAYWNCSEKINAVSILIPTTSTSRKNGGLQYVKKNIETMFEHKTSKDKNTLYIDYAFKEDEIEDCDTSLGDVILHKPTSIHKSHANESREGRNVFVAIFRSVE